MTKLPLIAITMGDPSGIGPEIIIKALQSPGISRICTPLVIGDRLALERARSACNAAPTIREVPAAEEIGRASCRERV